MDLLDSITLAKIPESLKINDSEKNLDGPIIEKYIRINDRLLRLERKAIPPKVKETTMRFRWRISRLDCRHVSKEYSTCCAFTNLALDKLEDHINGDISWSEFVDAWNKAKSLHPDTSNT